MVRLTFRCVGILLLGFMSGRASAGSALDRFPSLGWEKRSDWKDVKSDFPVRAVGDGKADDTAALQGALDALADGTTLYFPPGEYRITSSLELKVPKNGREGLRLIGHGRDTRIIWDGPRDGRMLVVRGVHRSRFTGIVWDGRGMAGVGISHDAVRFETEVTHEHEAFLGFTQSGIRIEPTHKQASAELYYKSCLFVGCERGVSFLQFNDYDNTLDGCEFINCGMGIEDKHGNFYARNCRFEASRIVDISMGSEHGSSVRRSVSVGSRMFLEHVAGVAPLTIENCAIDGWTGPDGAIKIHGAPVTMFDCAFTHSPDGRPPVVIGGNGQQLIVSTNRVAGGGALVRNPNLVHLIEIPAGTVNPLAIKAGEHFLGPQVVIPGKVFDAQRDFGAKGDGTTDDTAAIRKTIDAAMQHGRNAIAYLPTGDYVVSETLLLTGKDYFLGGSGNRSRLIWHGAADGTTIAVRDPQNLTLENISVSAVNDATQPGEGGDIEQTGSDVASAMTYDSVWVFGMYSRQPDRKGLRLTGLGSDALVHIRQMTGNLRIADSAKANILVDVSYEGTVTIQGKAKDRQGMAGFLTRLGTKAPMHLRVRDSQSVVMSDFYIEQADDAFLLTGNPGDAPGRVTLQGAKMETKSGPVNIAGYAGEVVLGHDQFYMQPKTAKFSVTSENSCALVIVGCMFYGSVPELVINGAAKGYLLGCSSAGKDADGKTIVLPKEPESVNTAARGIVSRAFDDLRRLGALDRRLNYLR